MIGIYRTEQAKDANIKVHSFLNLPGDYVKVKLEVIPKNYGFRYANEKPRWYKIHKNNIKRWIKC